MKNKNHNLFHFHSNSSEMSEFKTSGCMNRTEEN